MKEGEGRGEEDREGRREGGRLKMWFRKSKTIEFL